MKLIFTLVLVLSLSLLVTGGLDVLGGYEKIDVNDSGMLAALRAAKTSFQEKMPEGYHYYSIGKVLSARSQVVAGYNYDIHFTLTEHNCLEKTLGGNGIHCVTRDLLCQATIWAKLDDTYELTSIDCK